MVKFFIKNILYLSYVRSNIFNIYKFFEIKGDNIINHPKIISVL